MKRSRTKRTKLAKTETTVYSGFFSKKEEEYLYDSFEPQ
jgi:hypothetical protein